MKSNSCLSNSDLCRQISYFLEPLELLNLDAVSKIWVKSVSDAFMQYRNENDNVRYLAFKERHDYCSDKRIVCRIANCQNDKHKAGIFLYGGSFGSLHTNSLIIPESIKHFSGDLSPTANVPPNIGSFTSVVDINGEVLMMGGWDDLQEEVLRDVSRINLKCDEGWILDSQLDKGRSFSAATSTVQGDILLFGGGNSPYRGAEVFKDSLLRRSGSSIWEPGAVPDMQQLRCGHSAVTLFNDNVLVMGGYAGGTHYLNSVELLDIPTAQWTQLPAMSVPRSGMAAVVGPMGSVFVSGGSADGTIGHKICERFDPREGRWERMAPMHCGRGYTAGCLGSHLNFFVSGGCHELHWQGGIETYDFRANQWTKLRLAVPAAETGALTLVDEEEEVGEGVRFDEYLMRACHQMMYIL